MCAHTHTVRYGVARKRDLEGESRNVSTKKPKRRGKVFFLGAGVFSLLFPTCCIVLFCFIFFKISVQATKKRQRKKWKAMKRRGYFSRSRNSISHCIFIHISV